MAKQKLIVACALLALGGACAGPPAWGETYGGPRIVTVGGGVTETAFALGAENKIVGVDTSSVYPAEAVGKLPKVGYQRQLAAEGVVSLNPSLVLATADAGPPPALRQIAAAGVKIITIDNENSVAGAVKRIRQIAAALNAEARGEELVKRLESDTQAAQQCANQTAKPKVLFIYARGAGAAQVSGTKTAADAMINLSGGVNAVTEYENYKPLTPEALVKAQPDVILFPALGLQALGGIEAALQLPGVAETPAGKNRRVIAVDDLLLLGFTPRLGEGMKDLCAKLRNQ